MSFLEKEKESVQTKGNSWILSEFIFSVLQTSINGQFGFSSYQIAESVKWLALWLSALLEHKDTAFFREAQSILEDYTPKDSMRLFFICIRAAKENGLLSEPQPELKSLEELEVSAENGESNIESNY